MGASADALTVSLYLSQSNWHFIWKHALDHCRPKMWTLAHSLIHSHIRTRLMHKNISIFIVMCLCPNWFFSSVKSVFGLIKYGFSFRNFWLDRWPSAFMLNTKNDQNSDHLTFCYSSYYAISIFIRNCLCGSSLNKKNSPCRKHVHLECKRKKMKSKWSIFHI